MTIPISFPLLHVKIALNLHFSQNYPMHILILIKDKRKKEKKKQTKKGRVGERIIR